MGRDVFARGLVFWSLVGALAAALGWTMAASDWEPATDQVLRIGRLYPPTQKVILVQMDGDSDPATWSRVAQLLQDRGVLAVGLVGPSAPALPGTVRWNTEDGVDAGTFPQDSDGSVRYWRPTVDGVTTFPARLGSAAGLVEPHLEGRVALTTAGVPTLHHRQVSGLAPGSLGGRIAVMGPLDPWHVPTLHVPGQQVPLPEAVARVVAWPHMRRMSIPLTSAATAFLTLALGLTLTSVTSLARRWAAVTFLLILALGSLLLGASRSWVVPMEPFILALVGGVGAWTWRSRLSTEVRLQTLVDALVGRLGEGLTPSMGRGEEAWGALTEAAITLCHASSAWCFRRGSRGWDLVCCSGDATGAEGLTDLLPDRVDAPEEQELPAVAGAPPSLLFPLWYRDRVHGLLVVAPRKDGPLPADALRELAWYTASQVARMPSRLVRFATMGNTTEARLDELSVGLEYVLSQRDLLHASHEGSRTAHALYDPLGRPLIIGQTFRQILERAPISPENRLPTIWAALQGEPSHLTGLLRGGPPVRMPTPIRGVGVDAWLYACKHRDRLVGLAIELVDVSDHQASDTVKSGLLEMVSYRVRNILGAIRGYVDLLSIKGAVVEDVAQRISARCTEMGEIIDRFEGITREPDGVHAESVQVARLLQEVVAGARRTVGEHRVRLTDTPSALPPVVADHNALARALMELVLELARDAEGVVPILVSARGTTGGVEILVHADGPSLPFPLLQQLLHMDQNQGSALAHRLVTGMGGSLAVVGGGDQGARYRFYLPEA